MPNQKIKSAFSLVELAIVILVLGILALAVAGGNSLVKQAKIRKVVNEVNTLVSSYRTFESTYDAIAGDMIDAYDFFGTDCSTASGDCNGDGDTTIEGVAGASTDAALNDDAEYMRFFQHLKLATLLEGNYVGVGVESTDSTSVCAADATFSATCVRTRNYNVPKTAISTRGYYLVTYSSTHEQNMITLGDTDPTDADSYTNINQLGLLSALDAKSLDLKLDDGLAAQGRVRGKSDSDDDCLDSDTSEYDLTQTSENCYLEYIIR